MKPTYCFLCGKGFYAKFTLLRIGGLVQFRDYKPLRPGAVGHAHGDEWFCEVHLEPAQRLSHLDVEDAMEHLRVDFGIPRERLAVPEADPSLWIVSVGPHKGRVFGLVRQILAIDPATAKAMLDKGEFMVAQGWPSEFRYWQRELEQAGAMVEIRFD